MELEKQMISEGEQQLISKETEQPHPKIRIRLIPIWLRLILVVFLVAVAFIVGSIVGYSLIGVGKVSEVFQMETWTHIKDLVVKE